MFGPVLLSSRLIFKRLARWSDYGDRITTKVDDGSEMFCRRPLK